jgi:tRNA G18 (ribose-2'-O)-methylase SpoU
VKNTQLEHGAHKATSEKYSICFLANDIDVPMNVGSFFRIADALGVEKIYLTGNSVTPPNSKIKKTSRATEKYVPYIYEKDPLSVVGGLKAAGYKIVSLEITSTSIDIKDFHMDKSEKICLILGSESKGISQELLDVSDVTIHIPMLGENSSMNVANACSIATYEITRRLRYSSDVLDVTRTIQAFG